MELGHRGKEDDLGVHEDWFGLRFGDEVNGIAGDESRASEVFKTVMKNLGGDGILGEITEEEVIIWGGHGSIQFVLIAEGAGFGGADVDNIRQIREFGSETIREDQDGRFYGIMLGEKFGGFDYGTEALTVATDDFDFALSLLGDVPGKVGSRGLGDFRKVVHLELQVNTNGAVVGALVISVNFGGFEIFG